MVEKFTGASPVTLAFQRFLRKGGARVGLCILAVFLFAAMYAPFLCSETALLWHDGNGWSSPLLVDLFNRRSYLQRHDLLFNLAGIMLPIVAVAWWFLRRRWSFGRRLAWSFMCLTVIWIVCQIPMLNGGRALWDDRPVPACTPADVAKVEGAWALFPPIPHSWDRTYAGATLLSPGSINPVTGFHCWLGTDAVGHDLLTQLLFGARISLTIGLVATGLALAIGTIIGALSGYLGGVTDLILSRLVELMMCFPTFILILVVVAMLDRNIFVIMSVIGLTGWAGSARLVRGEFLSQSVREYVLAARSMGLPAWRIMFVHILPNSLPPLLITATFGVAGAVFTESGLSFLSLGDPTTPSWGYLLNQGRENIAYAWLIYAPGLAIFALLTALNLVGNGLQEAFDPKAN